MASSRNSQTQDVRRARTWLKPVQIEDLRDAALTAGATYLQECNDMLVAVLYDLGLRVGELVALDIGDFDLDESELYLPTHKQKDYPDPDHSPSPRHRMSTARSVAISAATWTGGGKTPTRSSRVGSLTE